MRRLIAGVFLLASASLSFGSITAITSGDFTTPTVVLFSSDGGPYDTVTLYTEAGATFGSTSSSYTYFGILDIGPNGNDIQISLDQAYNRFGFTANATNDQTSNQVPFDITGVDFYSGNDFTGAIGSDTNTVTLGPGPTFYGLSNTSAFQSIVIHFAPTQVEGFSPYLDDFKFEAGDLSTAPEPAAFGLLGAGIAALGLLAERKRLHLRK